MNASRSRRTGALLWLLGGALVLLLLAGELGGFNLQPGRTFLLPTQPATPQSESTPPGGGATMTLDTLLRGLLAIAWLLLPVTIILSLFSREGRRRLLTNVITIACLVIVLSRIQELPRREQSQTLPIQAIGEMGTAAGGEPLPPKPPALPDWLVWAISAGLVLLVGGLVFYVGRRLLFPRELPALAQIGAEAEKARRELDAGGAVEDVVVRCYRQMSRIVAEARELRRQKSTTPEEFAETLAAAGLPAGPLGSLTHLFEDVRYGSIPAGPQERQAAIDCLEAIAAACRPENSHA